MRNLIMTFALGLLVLPQLAAPSGARDWHDGFVPREPALVQPGRREWVWDGNDNLALEAPVTLHYSAGGPARIVATGPDAMLEQLRIGQGHIRVDDDWHFRDGDRVTVTVTGVPAHRIMLAGSGDATLDGLSLDHLRLLVAGSGTVSGMGRADSVDLSIAGSGNAELAHLATRRSNITVAGSGSAILSPREEAHVTITGSGAVRMAARPASFTQKVVGSGEVRFGN